MRFPLRPHPTFTGILRPALPILVLGTLMMSSASAQEDPYSVPPEERRSASLPLPAGLIVSTNYPLFGIDLISEDSDSEFRKSLRFDIFAYIDAWQFGYSRKTYGNVLSIVQRSIGRDTYSGWSFQYGSQPVTDDRAHGVDSGKDFSRTVFAVGAYYSTGYGSEVKPAFYMDINLGVALGDVAEGETEAIDSYMIMDAEAGAGVRIPIGISGLTLGAYGEFGFAPPPDRVGGDPLFMFALGLRATGAFGIDL